MLFFVLMISAWMKDLYILPLAELVETHCFPKYVPFFFERAFENARMKETMRVFSKTSLW